MKNFLRNSVLKKWVKQSCTIGFVAMPLALSACATDDDEKTRDFDLGDGTFKLTKIETGGRPFEMNAGSTFGIEVDWETESAFNFKYVGKGGFNAANGTTLSMSCSTDVTGKLQWKKINSDGIVEEAATEKTFFLRDCPVGPADVFRPEKQESIKIITKDIDDGFLVEIKNDGEQNVLYFENGTLRPFAANDTIKLHFFR